MSDILRNQRVRRARPVLAMAAVAFAVGAVVGAHAGSSPAIALAGRFVGEWTHGDYASMYSQLDEASRRTLTPSQLAAEYGQALTTATATSMRVSGRPHTISAGVVAVPVRVQTRLFGSLRLDFDVTVSNKEGARVVWSRSLAFPGLLSGEQLSRRLQLPQRAALLARDGSVLADGPAGAAVASSPGEANRSSPLGELAGSIVGTVGPVPSSRRTQLEAQGVAPEALVGLSGLERALDDRLRGTAGGELLAGARVLVSVAARRAPAVCTSVSPALQRSAASALGAQLGGVVALQPSTGQILAAAGIGLAGLQPPGSTFKMITLSGALQAKIATPQTAFPYATYSTLDGVRLNNANGEECGGTLENAFAVSCNSVFAPLGVKLGAQRLVAAAEGYGFNQDPGVPGAARSTLPPASQIQGELAIGSTAIGQGQVLATPLQMATVAATIADGGRRPQPTFLYGASAHFLARASSASVAHTVRKLMIEVVRSGTGAAAAIPGVVVAGKTGTAELKTQCTSSSSETPGGEGKAKEGAKEGCQASEPEASNTDAWFAAFAPAVHPRVVVCVMLVKDGAGGATAAPAARQVLETALQMKL
jgi:cell division protein FtsI/penicillin-binding protein 2